MIVLFTVAMTGGFGVYVVFFSGRDPATGTRADADLKNLSDFVIRFAKRGGDIPSRGKASVFTDKWKLNPLEPVMNF
jgi:hypothetical protein